MKVKLIGKQHISGVSKKSGKPFDNNVAYIIKPDREVQGYVGDSVWLNPVEYPLENLVLDATYDLEYNNRGYVEVFEIAE